MVVPEHFERRFVAGRILSFSPVCFALLALFQRVKPEYFPVMLIAWILMFVVLVLMGRGMATWHRRNMEEHGRYAIPPILNQGVSSEVMPIFIAVLIGGTITALIERDWRWMMIAIGIGIMLGVGLVLRWLVFDRWIREAVLRYPGPDA